jgi:hypothetical protein
MLPLCHKQSKQRCRQLQWKNNKNKVWGTKKERISFDFKLSCNQNTIGVICAFEFNKSFIIIIVQD